MYDLNNIVSIAKITEPTIFTDEQLAIINDLIKYQDYYDNRAFKYIAEEYPEFKHGIIGGKDYRPAQIPLNYGKIILDKLAAWQFEESIDFSVTSTNESRAEEIEKDLYEIHKRNRMDTKLLQAATESNISGGVAFKLKYEDKVKEPYPRILVRNRLETFVVTEFDDYENIIRVHFIAFQDEKTIWKQTFEMVGEVCYVFEAIYDTKDIKTPKEIIIPYQPLGKDSKWLDFLPVYIVSNMAQLGEVWGTSELRDLIPIIDEIDKKYSDLSDSLKFDMFAVTVFLNAKIPVDTNGKPMLKNKAGAAWNVVGLSPTDNVKPDVFKLQGTFNYAEVLKYHINSLVSALYEFAEAVHISPETVTGLPALSGIALKLLFATIISKTNRKNTVWKAKLAEIYMGTLKLKQIYEGYDIPDDLDIEIITHIPMPSNELEEVQIATNKLAAGLSSVETEMNNLGVENAQEELAKILAEKIEFDKTLNVDTRNNE
jgi:hypothetical protein